MPPTGCAARAAPPNANNSGASCSTARSSQTETASTITFLTAPLFAKATKNTQSTAREQEEHLSDLLVLLRHGERQDHADRAWKGNALLPLYDPPLSNAGRKQSFETALKYYALRQEKKVEQRIRGTFTLFLVSPFHRCLETAAVVNIIAFGGKLPMYVDPLLSDWQQAKVFRTAPTLGGAYLCDADAGASAASSDRLRYRPQWEALRSTLLPFLKTRSVEEAELLAEYAIPAEVAETWAAVAAQWLDERATLPVWTSAVAATYITEKAVPQQSSNEGENTPVPVSRRKGGRSPAPAPSPDLAGKLFKGCGVAHPESKADLVRRCEQVVATHYLQNGAVASEQTVPRAVLAAAVAERKTRLPKYFQTWMERPEDDRSTAGAPALLPPMHIMAVTHADVVSTLLEVCCPKYHDKGAGYSVPYCSITALQRHNNYYRIPPLEERQRAEASVSAQAATQHRGKGHTKKKVNAMPSKNVLALPSKSRALPPLSVEWNVDCVGSTDLLRTRIVIQYSK